LIESYTNVEFYSANVRITVNDYDNSAIISKLN